MPEIKIGDVFQSRGWRLVIIESPKMYNGKLSVRACVLHDNDIAANPTDLVLRHRDYPGYDGCTVMPNHKVVIPIDILEKKLFTISENDMKQVFLYMLADHTFSPLKISIRKIIRERLIESFYNYKTEVAA